MADGYAELYKEQKNFETLKRCGKEEFFGLRDFYRCEVTDSVFYLLNLLFVTEHDLLKIQLRGDFCCCIFYASLIKMVYAMAAKSGQRPGWHQLEHAIRRNFGGLIEGEPVEIFKRFFQDTDVSRLLF